MNVTRAIQIEGTYTYPKSMGDKTLPKMPKDCFLGIVRPLGWLTTGKKRRFCAIFPERLAFLLNQRQIQITRMKVPG